MCLIFIVKNGHEIFHNENFRQIIDMCLSKYLMLTLGVTNGPEGTAAKSLGNPNRNLICVIMMVKAAAAV